jgi:hypothetical protein
MSSYQYTEIYTEKDKDLKEPPLLVASCNGMLKERLFSECVL